jgi:hypothetical protein
MSGTGIDVSEVINSPEFQQSFTVKRSSGYWQNGVWQSARTDLTIWGVTSVASPKQLRMVPEGDINESMRVFWTTEQLETTNSNQAVDSTGGSSDIVIHDGTWFRIISSRWMADYGYWESVGARMSPQ